MVEMPDTTILKETTLKYSDNEIVFKTKNCAILGANGKGKSSFSKAISPVDSSTGSVNTESKFTICLLAL